MTYDLQQIKAVPIAAFLASIGHQPLKQTGGELLYFSPLREEKTASFFVNIKKNIFQDFGSDGGDSIKLVMLLNHCGFQDACKTLAAIDTTANPSFSFRPKEETLNEIVITAVKPLQHKALLDYVLSRAISLQLARKYLKEIHYQLNVVQYV